MASSIQDTPRDDLSIRKSNEPCLELGYLIEVALFGHEKLRQTHLFSAILGPIVQKFCKLPV